MTVRLQVSTCKSQQVGSREPHQMSVRGSGFTGFWVSPRRTAPCSAIAQLGAFSNSAPSFPYEMGIIMIRPVQMGCFKNKWINKCKVLGTLVWHIEVKKKNQSWNCCGFTKRWVPSSHQGGRDTWMVTCDALCEPSLPSELCARDINFINFTSSCQRCSLEPKG